MKRKKVPLRALHINVVTHLVIKTRRNLCVNRVRLFTVANVDLIVERKTEQMKARVREIFRRLALTDRIGIRRETRNQDRVETTNGRSTMEENSEDLAIVWRTQNSSTNEELHVLESIHSVSQAVRVSRLLDKVYIEINIDDQNFSFRYVAAMQNFQH